MNYIIGLIILIIFYKVFQGFVKIINFFIKAVKMDEEEWAEYEKELNGKFGMEEKEKEEQLQEVRRKLQV